MVGRYQFLRRMLLTGCLALSSSFAGAGDVSVKLPDGSVLKVKVGGNGMPDPVKTPMFTVNTVGMLMNAKDKIVIWTVGGEVKASSQIHFTIEPLLLAGWSAEVDGKPGGRFSFHGWDSDSSPLAWRWLDDPGTTYFPVRIRGHNLSTGEEVTAIACGAFDPSMKYIIKQYVECGGTKYSYTLPDGTFCEIPTRKGRILHTECDDYKIQDLTLRQLANHEWVWTLKADILNPQITKLSLASPLDPQWKVEEPVPGTGEVSLDFSPMKAGGPMWKWMGDSGNAFIPLQVEAFTPKGAIHHSFEWAFGSEKTRAALRQGSTP